MESRSDSRVLALKACMYFFIALLAVLALLWLSSNIQNEVQSASLNTESRIHESQTAINQLTILASQLKETPQEHCNAAKAYDMQYKGTISQNCKEGISDISDKQRKISDEIEKKKMDLHKEKDKGFWDYLPTWQALVWGILAIIGTTAISKLTELVCEFLCNRLKNFWLFPNLGGASVYKLRA